MAELNNIQKKNLADTLSKAGFNPLDFEPASFQGLLGIKLRHKYNKGSVSLHFSHDKHHWTLSTEPGQYRTSEYAISKDWSDAVANFYQWLIFYKKEINTADPWAQIPEEPKPDYQITGTENNTRLTVTEFETVLIGLDKIRKLFLESRKDSKEAQQQINQQLDNIIDSAKSFGRKDWFNLAIGSIVSIAISAALPPDVVRQGWQILKSTLSGIIQTIPVVLDTAKNALQ